ncbi:MAG: RnfABCDGE type electron transport complex subunit B [Oscillospiraceae bacterium]|jgi:Na+-translocating ferredoxin:NAD+ oxidoreductase RNF subunit RnfB|nr:RnfABCDGE type electron transport complex subunit B [Oscillospiraceae bacterium]
MTTILFPVAVVAAIGLISGLALAIAAIVMHVPIDPRTEQVLEALPGANCGACGFSGCAGYAEAVVSGGAPLNQCIPGGNATAQAIAALMGATAAPVAERRAFVRCGGDRETCKQSFAYRGEQTCAAASLLYSGQKQCNYGCLGFGDCAALCPHNAISLVNGLARVDSARCVGCALCLSACPKGMIVMAETRGRAVNRCCSEAPGALVRRHCAAGCIGCRLCEKACPAGAIKINANLARVDSSKCTGCGLCVQKCPTKCLSMA